MLYEIRNRKTDEVVLVVSDNVCIIGVVMVEGVIKGVPQKQEVFIPGPGFPPIPVESHYAVPVEKWPDSVTTK